MIENLDDLKAQQILSMVVRSRAHESLECFALDIELCQTLAVEFDLSFEPGAISEGELAKHALLVLAEDRNMRAAIDMIAANWDGNPQKFEFGTVLALSSAVLIVLQTRVKFERSPSGKWRLQVEKKATTDALLRGLVQKLITYMK